VGAAARRVRRGRQARRRLLETIEREFPQRLRRAGDTADLGALAPVPVHCSLVTRDALMADVIRRTRRHVRHRVELYCGRHSDVRRLRDRLAQL
jgi:hypothetical protein